MRRRAVNMNFVLLYKERMTEVSFDDFDKFARSNGLMEMDLDGFAIDEDGNLLLLDECGNFTHVPREEKYIIRYFINEQVVDEIY